jgi:5-(carboxyamino)imidazole ribonucleotide synthase
MSSSLFKDQTVGILGGGQLGRMLIQAGLDLNISFRVMDPDPEAPCSRLAPFTAGKLTDAKAVLAFARDCDVVTIEIENVSTVALKQLAREGTRVYPQPEVVELIQDKRTQKQFYKDHGIPTAEFILTANREEVIKHKAFLPAVNKLGREGYDGRGVQVLKSHADLPKAFDAPGLLEKFVDFEKEIAVIVARSANGDISCFPAVEMVFHPEANLVQYLLAPAPIADPIASEAERIATKLATELRIVGLLAVEMFITRDGKVLVNEVAPRPHNSGHQSIEANVTSQYEQHLRAILGLPLGSTAALAPSAMVNLLGEEGHTGTACYEGLDKVLAVSGIHVHLYGKKMTKPWRKMGHVTIVDKDVKELYRKIQFVRETLKVKA